MSTQAEKPKKKTETDRRNGLSALASDVPALTKLALGRKGFAEASLIGEWATIVGADIARLCIPVKMRLPRQKKDEKPVAGAVPANVAGGTLTLRASPSASLEVQHLKPRILERIQRYFGYPLINELKIEIGDRKKATKPRRTLLAPMGRPDLSAVKDPDIREALERLGAARAKRR
jgi:hypothetical protein